MNNTNIATLFTVLLLSSASLFAQDPVAFDGSQAREMQVVWQRETGVTGWGAYFQNVGDIPDNNFVSLTTNGIKRAWRTTPKLDTTQNVVEWVGARGGGGYSASFDYDGLPPLEVFSDEYIFRPSADGKIMTAIDTVGCLSASDINPGNYTVDVDGNGLLDIVGLYKGPRPDILGVILNGAGLTKGCTKVLVMPEIFPNRTARNCITMRMMRCADGKLRIVYVGTIREFKSGIYLLDVAVQRTDSGYEVSYTMADSIEQPYFAPGSEPAPWVIKPLMCVDDQNTGHQYALVAWEDGYHRNHNTTVMYEVTNGKLVEKISTVGPVVYMGNSSTYDNAFDDSEAVIRYSQKGVNYFARISTFYRPFAKIPQGVVGIPTFIDDQFGDGSRDLFLVNFGTSNYITLVNFDLRPTSVAGDDTPQQSGWALLSNGRVTLKLEGPSMIGVEAVNAIGQKRSLVSASQAPAGVSTLDLTQQLAALPKGAWFIRVSDGVRIVSLSYLR